MDSRPWRGAVPGRGVGAGRRAGRRARARIFTATLGGAQPEGFAVPAQIVPVEAYLWSKGHNLRKSRLVRAGAKSDPSQPRPVDMATRDAALAAAAYGLLLGEMCRGRYTKKSGGDHVARMAAASVVGSRLLHFIDSNVVLDPFDSA